MRLERRYRLQSARTAASQSDGNLARILFGSALLILFLLAMAIATREHDPDVAALVAAEGYGVSQ